MSEKTKQEIKEKDKEPAEKTKTDPGQKPDGPR